MFFPFSRKSSHQSRTHHRPRLCNIHTPSVTGVIDVVGSARDQPIPCSIPGLAGKKVGENLDE